MQSERERTANRREVAVRDDGRVMPLLTLDEAAGILRVPASWLRHRVANREIACTRLGRHIRFTHDQVAAIVDSSAQSVVEQPLIGLTRRARRPR